MGENNKQQTGTDEPHLPSLRNLGGNISDMGYDVCMIAQKGRFRGSGLGAAMPVHS